MSRRVIQAEGIPLLDECLWVLAMDLWGLLRAPQSPKLYVSWLRLTDHVWNILCLVLCVKPPQRPATPLICPFDIPLGLCPGRVDRPVRREASCWRREPRAIRGTVQRSKPKSRPIGFTIQSTCTAPMKAIHDVWQVNVFFC